MNDPSDLRFRFGEVVVDLQLGRLFCAGEEVLLRPKSFEVLAHLVRHAGRVVSREELVQTVWPRVIVTEDSLTQCIHDIRQALAREGRTLLRTLPRRGYVFDGVQSASAAPTSASAGLSAATGRRPAGEAEAGVAAVPRLRRDGIAVLPFALAGPGHPGDLLLVDGLAHDVIGRLACMRGFHVIARGSAFALRQLHADPRAVGRALGVLHVVTGTAAVRDGRLRLVVEIVEADGAGILWTGEFVEDLHAYAGLIGALTDRIANAVQRQISLAETRRALALPEESLGAWEHFHAGLAGVYSNDPARIGAALDHFRAATRLAPHFARAHAGQSVCHWVLAFSGLSSDLAADVAAARRTAEAGMEADDEDPYTLWSYGRALGLEGDQPACLRHAERAVALSPCFAHGHFEIGLAHALYGEPLRGLEHIDLLLALSPLEPALYSAQLALAHAEFRLGRAAAAADWARASAAHPENFATVLAPAALILAGCGDLEGARAVVARLRALAADRGMAPAARSAAALSPELATLCGRFGPLLGLEG
ncbi:winged helix-turn-helix domain-containing protein [Aquibium microcysteis]|uniref:winged helix-turn-helix domain-containing protein n=1 Tax=Aquibium microcysteis TaxID=675281 RepID=UPI00165D2585|nr:winged helix-turn-helix domain-containing protein [Aquibium microcysteis]